MIRDVNGQQNQVPSAENTKLKPLQCEEFLSDSENPIWFGKVEGLNSKNQHLLIVGGFRLDEALGFDLEYMI